MNIKVKQRFFISFSYLIVILWMLLIYTFSSQPATESNQLSKSLTETVVETVEKIAPNSEINSRSLNNLLRKNAHFFLYLILGVLIFNVTRIHIEDKNKTILIALCICLVYSITDEIHQLFIPGRGAEIKDILIDTTGSITGIGIYFFSVRLGLK